MLVNDTGFEFYRWNMNNNVTPSILLSGQFFNPVWFPAENTVNFSYNIGQDCKITDYGKSVIEAHG
ncbi:MAG: hypothetical protein Q4F54_00315 [Coriobacteriia bacterium]|nr:hypothetical protein [Coriobacteriia bacterium]